ncbi:MAG: hypothetical protein BWY59_00400 [Verrucomicrobia bacterium ADurb.Bin345]|nr:MAG: hypothetical protein BWY59_00400 [Verrucomicrobia bacterium ADurb.Bin345]
MQPCRLGRERMRREPPAERSGQHDGFRVVLHLEERARAKHEHLGLEFGSARPRLPPAQQVRRLLEPAFPEERAREQEHPLGPLAVRGGQAEVRLEFPLRHVEESVLQRRLARPETRGFLLLPVAAPRTGGRHHRQQEEQDARQQDVKPDALHERFSTSARYFPVYDEAWAATSSGAPAATTRPPASPPSGPRSIT